MYECHITINLADKQVGVDTVRTLHLRSRRETGIDWSTSEIERDPVLGKASYFYLTTHHRNLNSIREQMHNAEVELILRGVKPVRSKIELIVYDTKTGIGLP